MVGAEAAGLDEANSRWVWASVEGQPEVVGRLRFGVIDYVHISFPKEETERAEGAIGSVIDKLVDLWLDENGSFEELQAAATPLVAPVLESRGFRPLEAPDLTALARNEPIVTHCGDLDTATRAYATLPVKLQSQRPRPREDEPPRPKDDPFRGLGRTFF